MNELMDEIDQDNPNDPRKAGEEQMAIKQLFGKKITLRDLAKAWGKSPPGVMKFADETMHILAKTMRDMGIKTVRQFKSMPEGKFKQFLELLKVNMRGRHGGTIVSGR